VSCAELPDAFLEARLAGAIEAELHWQAREMQCDGMRRPDGQGLRVTFSGRQGGKRLTLVFGVPRLAEGAAGRAVPVNVTLIREGGMVYGTRGEQKCVLDEVRQTALAASPVEPGTKATPGGSTAAPAGRHWQIEARGFCLDPARSVGDGRDAILLSRFDFRGRLTWEPDLPAAPPPAVPVTAARIPPGG
jgi:hypothetical protein